MTHLSTQARQVFLCLVFCLVLPGAALASGLASPAKGVDFVPHKAVYDIKLVSTKSGSQIINISGKMFYEWQPSCEAWISNHRFNLYYEYADAPPMQINSDFSTFEAFDGSTMDFTSQRKRDGILFEELRGRATSGKVKGEALYSIPKGLSFDLPEGTLFPMGHTRAVLGALKEGKKFFQATVFDGSDEDGPVEISSFMGSKVDAASRLDPVPEIDMKLVDTPAWSARLAFFPLNDPSETADYEMSLVFHENGIISDMLIEYDDFTISQKLVSLEALKGGCESGKEEATIKPQDTEKTEKTKAH